MKRRTIKCVVWDLDNTIWDGVLLEGDDVRLKEGVEDVLRALDARGILNSIASRNDAPVTEAKLREFGIHELFVYPQISWGAKSAAVATIAGLLNIATDALAFVDDDPFERDEVAAGLPDVLCLDATEVDTFLARPEFAPATVTVDARNRRTMVQSEVRRSELAQTMAPAEFLDSLGMVLTVAEGTEDDLARSEELSLRTNQLNSTGETFDREELESFLRSPSHLLYVAELDDRYGPYGKIGLALVELQDDCWLVRLFLVSCRVMARGVAPALLRHLVREAGAAGLPLRARFIRTDRNRPMYLMFKFEHFREIVREGDVALLQHDGSAMPEPPSYIEMRLERGPSPPHAVVES